MSCCNVELKISPAKNARDLQKCLGTTVKNLNSVWRSSEIWILLVFNKTTLKNLLAPMFCFMFPGLLFDSHNFLLMTWYPHWGDGNSLAALLYFWNWLSLSCGIFFKKLEAVIVPALCENKNSELPLLWLSVFWNIISVANSGWRRNSKKSRHCLYVGFGKLSKLFWAINTPANTLRE